MVRPQWSLPLLSCMAPARQDEAHAGWVVVICGSRDRRQAQCTSVLQDYGTLDDASPHEMANEGDPEEPHLDGQMEHEAGVPSDQQPPEQADELQPEQQAQQLASHHSLPTGGPKSRLRWTPKLHQLFVEALRALGGPHVATPKQVCTCPHLLKVSWHSDGLKNIMHRMSAVEQVVSKLQRSCHWQLQHMQGVRQQHGAGRSQGRRVTCFGDAG